MSDAERAIELEASSDRGSDVITVGGSGRRDTIGQMLTWPGTVTG